MTERPRVLIIDDDPDFLNELAAVLSGAGYDVATAADTKKAEPVLKRESPAIDLLIVDLVLPGMVSGLDLISVVTRTPPSFKIVVTSAVYSNPTLDYIAERVGAAAFIHKSGAGEPFNRADWLETVQRVLDPGATATEN